MLSRIFSHNVSKTVASSTKTASRVARTFGHGPVSKKEQYNITWTKLNPNKHVYMNHQFQKSHDDYYVLGEYPTPEILAEKIPAATYQHQAVDIAFNFFSGLSGEFNLDADNFKDVQHHSWQVHGVDIDAYKYQLLSKLARGIVIRENKNRPKIEQRLRDQFSRE